LSPVLRRSDILEGYTREKQKDIIGKLERNFYTEYFWMPSPSKAEEPLIADLSHFFSVNLDELYASIQIGTVTRRVSLSREGYFLFMIKLAWFMLRPATPETARNDLDPWKFA
jgi:hypothetical protein